MQTSVRHLITTETVTFFDTQYRPYHVNKDADQFGEVVDELKKPFPDLDHLIELSNKAAQVIAALDEAFASVPSEKVYLDRGVITVTRAGVMYNGSVVEGPLFDRMMEILHLGLPLAPWVQFAENLLMNPADHARDELYLWLEGSDLPITEDGCFLAYKVVTDDYKDWYSRTFDNSVGQLLQMAREDVDPVRDRTCSRGFHFCSRDYLGFYGFGPDTTGGRGRVMVVKVNPADVVSIPSDYQNAKGRCWRYEVVDEIDNEGPWNVNWGPITDDYDETPEVDEDEGGFDPELEALLAEEEAIANEALGEFERRWAEVETELAAEGIIALRSRAAQLRRDGLVGETAEFIWKLASKDSLISMVTAAIVGEDDV